jgi:hypothetical protein
MWLNPIDYFAGLIERETGIVYVESNIFQLKMRLEEFCRIEKISNVDADEARVQGEAVILFEIYPKC